MLWLTCTVGGERFAIDAMRVAEVLPAISWKQVMGGEHGVVGLLNYHHTAVPVLDLSLLLAGTPSTVRMRTRILLVHAAFGAPGMERIPLGLVVEGMVETLRCDPQDFVMPDKLVITAPYLGPVRPDTQGILQRIEIDRLLAPAIYTQVLEQCTPTL